jgi:PTH1 family peptidyl-tRNA hydrolase
MYLIAGLGNPGEKYKFTRHNAGFRLVELLQQKWHFSDFKPEKKFKAEISVGEFNNQKCILIKPQTYMNLSGEAILPVTRFFKINLAQMIVIQDDIDLPLGKIRIKTASSAGGHNGIKSIMTSLNDPNFIRLKLGIENRTDSRIETSAYVLGNFSIAEQPEVETMLDNGRSALEYLLINGFSKAMNCYN